MGIVLKMPPPRFSRLAREFEGHTVIISKCSSCGEKHLVSLKDGSLTGWEKGHVCAATEGNVIALKGKGLKAK